MAQTYRQQFLGVMRANERDMMTLFSGLANRARIILTRSAGGDGVIPVPQSQSVRTLVGQQVTAQFLQRTPGGDIAAFIQTPAGGVQPLSPYMRVMWGHIEVVTRVAVEQQAALMQRLLRRDDRVVRALRMAPRSPFAWARAVSEQAEIRPNPFARYDPPHIWVDPNGYRLSDRIWRVSVDTRRRVDLLLDEAIASGRSALDIANDLERFLQPGRLLRRTTRPYGRDASYDAMRLARTEITRAHAQATLMSGAANPFVAGVESVLSPAHECCDICDTYAAESQADPWPVDNPPAQIPYHPHCMCYYRMVLVEDTAEILEDLRRQVARGRGQFLDMVGPLLAERFAQLLLRVAQPEPAVLV